MCLREGENRQPQTGSGGGQGTHRGREKDRREGDKQGEAWEAEGSLSLLSSHTRIQWGSPSPLPLQPCPCPQGPHTTRQLSPLSSKGPPFCSSHLPASSQLLSPPHRFHFLTHSSICRLPNLRPQLPPMLPAPTPSCHPAHPSLPPPPWPGVISNPHSQHQTPHSLPPRHLFALPCVYQQPRQPPSLSCGLKTAPPAASHLSPGLSPIPSVLPKNNHGARHAASHTLVQCPHRSWKHDDP